MIVVVVTTVTAVAGMNHHPVIQQEEVSVMIVVGAHSLAEARNFVNHQVQCRVPPEGRTGDASVLEDLEEFGQEIGH